MMEEFIRYVLKNYKINDSKIVERATTKLLYSAKVDGLYKSVKEIKEEIFTIFKMHKENEEFKDYHLVIDNANAKKEYSYTFNLKKFPNIKIKEIRNLNELGLEFNLENLSISGKPQLATNIDLQIVFYNEKDETSSEDIKIIPFIINPDPKDLWKNIPSSKDIKFPKDDEDSYFDSFLDKNIVIASKRGRSHAHEGTCRDDHFFVQKLPNQWEIVAVADGAGSAKFSRKGSEIATTFIAESFNNEELLEKLSTFVTDYYEESNLNKDENLELIKKVKTDIFQILYKNILGLHNELKKFAEKEEIQLKDLNTTLIFSLIKKFEFGYSLLSFGVGDSPICIVNKDNTKVQLINKLDVGDYGGGTRFITMLEIFTNNGDFPAAQRFSIQIFKDFSKLFLMTDGIYDPKFVTENKLENIDNWNIFLNDLNGENEDHLKVDFQNQTEVQFQLLKWLDFWSMGNHDDRTIAIIY